jgi:hypothetical protein
MTIKKQERNSYYSEIKDFCHFAKPDDTMEITEWGNREGFDLRIEQKIGESHFTNDLKFTFGEFELLNKLVKKINK